MASGGDGYGNENNKRSDRRISGIGRYGYRLSGGSFKGKFGAGSSLSSPGTTASTTYTPTSSQYSSSTSAYPPRISITSSSGLHSNLSPDDDSQNPQVSSTSLSRHLSLSQKRRRSPRSGNSFLSSNNGSDSGASSNRSSANASPRSSLTNKIGDYASRYLDTIRPKWSHSGGGNSGTPRVSVGLSRSPSSSRSESPMNPPLASPSYVTSSGTNQILSHKTSTTSSPSSSSIPHILTFRQRERLPPTSFSTSNTKSNLSESREKRSFSPSLKPYSHSGSDRWFRHITEASNAYKQRGYRQGGDSASARPQNGLDDLHGRGGKHEGEQSLGVPGSGLFDGDKKGQPMGRSQSFNEQTTSSREPHSRERGPSSPPEDIPSEPDTFATKTGDSTDSGTTSGGGNSGQGKKKTYQRVEILKIAEPCPLIDPSQVVVTQGEILRADPVLTPIEKLRRKDAEVAKALEEKERLIADILHIPPPLSSTSLDVYGRASSSGDIENPYDDPSGALDIQHQMSDKDATKVLLAALEQAKNLSDLVNESLTLSEEATVAASADVSRLSSPPPSTAPQIMHSISSNVEDGSSPISSTGATGELVQGTNTGDNSMTSSELQVREFKGANFGLSNSRKILPGPPPERLVAITNNMNSHLTSLLAIFKEREEERERLRRELQRSQEQVHALLSQSAASHRASSGNLSAAATISESTATAATPSQESRPVSYISVEESSGPEMSEKNHESEDDASATITTTTTITLTTLDPENNNDSVSIPIKTTTTSTKSSVTDRDNNNKIQCDNKNKGESDTHPQNSQNVSKLINKASRSTSASTEERNQSTDEQDISFSRLSMEDRDCSNTDASQASTASNIKHQPPTEKGEEEANDNDKPEDISKQDTEKAEITVVLETTSTTSEV